MGEKMTIRDIARLSGVAPSTVSRVLDDSQKISAATKKRVMAVVEEYKYHPQTAARNLARNKTSAIGIVISQEDMSLYSSSFFHEALNGICGVLSQHGYDLIISSGGTTQVHTLDRLIGTSRIDGIILLRSVEHDANIRFLLEKKFPFVLIGSSLESEEIYSVDNDNVRAAYDLAVHLYKGGRRRIALVGGAENVVFIRKRLEGYRSFFAEKKLPLNPDFIKLGGGTEDAGYYAMKQLLENTERPDAVMVMDDDLCVGVMKAVAERGVRVPEEMAVACFNDSAYTKYSKPSLTTVSLGFYELGASAARLLLQVLDGVPAAKGCRYVGHLITARESTKPLV